MEFADPAATAQGAGTPPRSLCLTLRHRLSGQQRPSTAIEFSRIGPKRPGVFHPREVAHFSVDPCGKVGEAESTSHVLESDPSKRSGRREARAALEDCGTVECQLPF